MGKRRALSCFVGTLAAALCACGPADDEADTVDEFEYRSSGGTLEALVGRPGDNSWIGNGLEDPDVSGIDPAFGLSTPQGMAEGIGLLTDADLRGTAEYLVECALPLGQSITKTVDGQSLVLEGLLGLAPQWHGGSCDEDCQQWVTACLLARTNVSGESVTVWIRSDHPAIGYGLPDDVIHEASWFGNLFAGPDEQYLCKGAPTGPVAAAREGRTCSQGQGCGFTKYGSCSNRCTLAGPDQDVPTECKPGNGLSQPAYHTISTYVEI